MELPNFNDTDLLVGMPNLKYHQVLRIGQQSKVDTVKAVVQP